MKQKFEICEYVTVETSLKRASGSFSRVFLSRLDGVRKQVSEFPIAFLIVKVIINST